jgi:hypothetical protein
LCPDLTACGGSTAVDDLGRVQFFVTNELADDSADPCDDRQQPQVGDQPESIFQLINKLECIAEKLCSR